MWKHLVLAAIAASSLFIANAQETSEFKPSGKIDGKIYSNYSTTVSGSPEKSGFAVERAYLGYTYNLSSEFSSRVLLDIGSDADNGRDAFFKNAVVYYTKNNLKIGFGLQDTYNFKMQEKVWGKRYIDKSFQDVYNFAYSADLGATAQYTAGDISFDLGLYNGEGYKKTTNNNELRGSLGVTASLLDNKLLLRASDDYMEDTVATNSIALFAGYMDDNFSIGGEYNMQTIFAKTADLDKSGLSLYAAANVSKKGSLFGRFDLLQVDNSVTKVDAKMIIFGYEHKLLKNLSASANYRHYMADGSDDIGRLFFNMEIKF